MISLETTFFEDVSVEWFRNNWIDAGLVPARIIYENLLPEEDSFYISAGGTIGFLESGAPLHIRVEYNNGRSMDPVEFFSLLFWKKECDPVFTEHPDDCEHLFFKKMSGFISDGEYGTFNDDDWLGLRPPLRTYQRVRWEAMREYSRPDFRERWKSVNNTVNPRIINPFVHGGVMPNVTTCNILAGEMLFRAGFKTFVHAGGLCNHNKIQYRLKYRGPTQLYRDHFSLNRVNISGYINYHSSAHCSDTKTHMLGGSFAEKIDVSQLDINAEIGKGNVFMLIRLPDEHHHTIKCDVGDRTFETTGSGVNYNETHHHDIVGFDGVQTSECSYTSGHKHHLEIPGVADGDTSDPKGGDHVAVIDQVTGNGNSVFRVIDQNISGWSRENYSHRYTPPREKTIVLKMIPGGDPTQEWGKLDLNCLQKV
ncbi:MAG TPA: hypothetical protein HA257_07325 [Candidatus Methanoperedenaceae archaeon]|nr:hypothetical protein [Candidatus Methanoperedenaceae archaeon]